MTAALKFLLLLAAYLLGSVPFGLALTRLFTGRDVRTVGSGNIGASNVARAAGKKLGVLTLVLDALKATLPMLVVRSLWSEGAASAELWSVLTGLAAFAGHLWPVWLGFKGGKGVATALGVFVVLSPVATLVALAAFGIAYGLTRVPAVGSLTGVVVCCAGTIVHLALARGGLAEAFGSPVSWAALLVAAVIFWRHRANLERLLKGAENKV